MRETTGSETRGSEALDPEILGSEILDQILRVALEASDAGAKVLRRWFRAQNLRVSEKELNDFVTEADRESERAILGVISKNFPDHGILAEESGASGGELSEGFQWIVDPLDGTANFLHGLPVFCISIACRWRDQMVVGVIYDPLKDDRFWASKGGGAFWNGQPMSVTGLASLDSAFLATGFPFRAKPALDLYLKLFQDVFERARGIRRCGAAALDLAYTAAGIFDGFFEFRLSPWDVAAGGLLVEEAGGIVTNLDGGRNFLSSGSVLAGGVGVHSALRSQLQALDVTEEKLAELLACAAD